MTILTQLFILSTILMFSEDLYKILKNLVFISIRKRVILENISFYTAEISRLFFGIFLVLIMYVKNNVNYLVVIIAMFSFARFYMFIKYHDMLKNDFKGKNSLTSIYLYSKLHYSTKEREYGVYFDRDNTKREFKNISPERFSRVMDVINQAQKDKKIDISYTNFYPHGLFSYQFFVKGR